jgi:hypothetical protein
VRALNLLLLQESFAHSIWGPFGVKLMADQGRVALTRGDLGFSHLKHSFAGGLTLRAGGFPMIFLIFARGRTRGSPQHGEYEHFVAGWIVASSAGLTRFYLRREGSKF